MYKIENIAYATLVILVFSFVAYGGNPVEPSAPKQLKD